MLAIAIIVIAMPAWPVRQAGFQQCVNHFYSINYPYILRAAQPETHQRQGIRTDDVYGWLITFTRRPILDRHKSFGGRSGIGDIRADDAYVISIHSHLARQVRISRIDPTFDVGIPGVGRFP